MSDTKRGSFKDILFIQNRINRLLDDTLAKPICFVETDGMSAWSPPVDIYEVGGNIVLKAELPGINEKDIGIEVRGDTLILKGERKLKKDFQEENFFRIERYYGSFHRYFTIPRTIDKDKMKAKYEDGVLEVVLPKKIVKDKKLIKVKVNHDGKKSE